MCGIFGMISNKKIAMGNIVLDGLKTLEYRGYDSWGVVVDDGGKISMSKKIGKIGGATLPFLDESVIGIGHTRWATHGGVTDENAHPHLSYDGRFAIVHNGIVENYLELKEDLISGGIKFISETDSEVVAHLLAKISSDNPKLDLKEVILKVFNMLQGLNAFLIMDKKMNKVVAIKSGSPLVIGFGNKDVFFASDAVALLPHTKRVYFLDDGEMFYDGKLFDVASGKKKSFEIETLDLGVEEISKTGFDHFIMKEINEQPRVIETVLDRFDEQKEDVLSLLRSYNDYCLIGCGTASYAALMGQYLFADKGLRATAYSGSESAHFIGNLPKTTLPIFLSQSGETIDLIEQVNQLQKDGKEIMAMVNRVSSTLDRKAEQTMYLHAGPEISVVSTKAFMAKLTTLIMLTHALAGEEDIARKLITKAISASRDMLKKNNLGKIEKIARRLNTQQSAFALGRGKNYPIAMEAALKVKEAAYIHMEGFAGGELKHGVISLIEEGTNCVVFVGNDKEDQNIISNAMEVKARGAHIIGIASRNHPVFDQWLEYEDCGVASVLVETIIVQLIAYYMSIQNGIDPDKPRNLAKSVTVK